jgi:hypothetical protein
VHFRNFDADGPHDRALGTTDLGTFAVWGEIYTAWYSRDFGNEIGIPISDEQGFSFGDRDFRVNKFLSADGVTKSIYWSPDRDGYGLNWVAGLAQVGADSHFYLDNGDGQGPQVMDFAPRGGPTGFERTPISEPLIPGSEAIGTTSAPLTAGSDIPNFQTTAFQQQTDFRSTNSYAALLGSIAVQPTIDWASILTSTSMGMQSSTADVFASLFTPVNPGALLPPPVGSGTPTAGPSAAAVAPMADLTNVAFSLTSLDTGETHQLLILTQTGDSAVSAQAPGAVQDPAVRPESPGAAQAGVTFTAVWDPNGDDLQATGTLSYDAAGNVQIQFSWVSPQDGTLHAFAGAVTGAAGSYHIEGTTYVRSTGESHDMVGDQRVVADFTNVTFAMTDDNGTAHQLLIQAQSPQADGSATFTGICDGQFGNGSIFYDAAGTLHLWFVGEDSSTVDSIISGDAGAYQFAGNLTSPDGTTIHATGVQTAAQVASVADFTNASFALSEENGTAHQLQITDQTAQPNGTATFNGAWDGQSVTGTLVYDAAGNVNMLFSGDSGTWDATIAGSPGAYQIEAQWTMPGSDTPLPVTGNQIA